MKPIISVNYKRGDTDIYDGRKYSYYCALQVKIGDMVIAPTAKGDRVAQVCEVDIPIEQVNEKVRPLLKEISAFADTAAEEPKDTTRSVVPPAITSAESETYNTTSLIEVKQLPIIEDQLRKVKEDIEARVQGVLSLACTEETYKEVKKARAALNNERAALEERRKSVKKAILAPYERFEALYKECAGDIYADADKKLKERIAEVEDSLKQEKNEAIDAYFLEYAKSKSIPAGLISFAESGIKVGMTESKRSLQKQVAAYIDCVADEVALIETQQHKEEIYIEYQKSLNVAQAISSVSARHIAIETERRRREECQEELDRRNAAREQTEAVTAEIAAHEQEAVAPPTASLTTDIGVNTDHPVVSNIDEDKLYAVSFKVIGTLSQLKELKAFMNERGVNYEQLPQ